MKKVLIANRGEIAVRITRAVQELGMQAVAVYPNDDAQSLHVRHADAGVELSGRGAAAYLDIPQLVAIAQQQDCDGVHPGYGFLSENADFAAAVEAAGLTFIGPSVEALRAFGDKAQARAIAQDCAVPILAGSSEALSLAQAEAFFNEHSSSGILLKAIAGGGGRGMRVVREAGELADAYARCASEAKAAFGNDGLYAEQLVDQARHIEVQIIGDGSGAVSHVWERECSVQRRHQKLVEIAPSPTLDAEIREQMCAAAVSLGRKLSYSGLGTIEFLLDAESGKFFFIEANARLQVEHTVTEEVTGVDLVQAQVRIASGASLADLDLMQASIPAPRGFAIQLRVNTETMTPEGEVKPTGGRLTKFEAPTGPGLRTDTYAYGGYSTNPNYDSLLAKLICHNPSSNYGDAVRRAQRALKDAVIEGVATNQSFLQALLATEDFAANRLTTRYVDAHMAELVEAANPTQADAGKALAGAQVNSNDPLAVLDHGKGVGGAVGGAPSVLDLVSEDLPPGTEAIFAPMQGTVVSFEVTPGDEVFVGKLVLGDGSHEDGARSAC
jgi:acetyl/propionyl-CoA carboxylase alpha subunit